MTIKAVLRARFHSPEEKIGFLSAEAILLLKKEGLQCSSRRLLPCHRPARQLLGIETYLSRAMTNEPVLVFDLSPVIADICAALSGLQPSASSKVESQ